MAVVDSDRLVSNKPHLQPTDQEGEVGQPQREEQEELYDVVANNPVPKPVLHQLFRLYGETRRESRRSTRGQADQMTKP